nr:rod shape-determining protein [Ardenticatena sp.]
MISPLSKLFGLFSRDIAMDLGTANTVVAVRGQGIVINEPSVVAVDKRNGQVLAVGADAKEMVGRTPAHIVAVRPLRDGVISDFDVTHAMISEFIKKVHERTILPVSPRMVIGIPGGVTEVERIAVRDAAVSAGAREVHLIEQPMAAAIGSGLPVTESVGSMVVDIGGGTTEIAVISMGGIVVNNSIRIAGDELDEAIIDYARQRYNLLIGPRMAERVKIQIGSAYPLEDEMTMEIRGRNLITGLPEAVTVTSIEIREAISGPVGAIVEATRAAIDQTPPELVADLMENGIALAGGGALLKGLAQRLTDETRMRVYVADDPLSCVVRGCAHALERADLLKKVQALPHRPVTPY